MFPQTLSLFAIVACVSARVQPRLLNRIIINGPTGRDGQAFETTVDNGASWKDGADSMPLDAQTVVGFRKTNDQDSAVIIKNALPAGTSTDTWLTTTNGDDYLFEIGDTESYISTDYTQSPEQLITPDEWMPIRISAVLDINNGGICDDVADFTATIYYNDGSAPVNIVSTPDQWDYPAVQYTIANVRKVQNITFPFATPPIVIVPGSEAPFVAKYTSAQEAPLVTALMEMRGSFCNGDD